LLYFTAEWSLASNQMNHTIPTELGYLTSLSKFQLYAYAYAYAEAE
jgi:hypothetical protein